MKVLFTALLSLSILVSFSRERNSQIVLSPHWAIQLTFELNANAPVYRVSRGGTSTINNSMLGFVLNDKPALDKNFKIRKTTRVHDMQAWWSLAYGKEMDSEYLFRKNLAADFPQNYEGKPAFKFIEDVPTDWEITKVMNGEIGQYITTIRKDRNSADWYLGAITNDAARELEVSLIFLAPGKKYSAEIYRDGKDADVVSNPLPIDIIRHAVDSSLTLKLKLASGGGTAIRSTLWSSVWQETHT